MGEHVRRALDGVRVLDLTHQVAGPSVTLMLAFLGAEAAGTRRRGAAGPGRDDRPGRHVHADPLRLTGREDMLADPRYATITGRGQVTIPGYPVRMSRSPARVAAPPQPGAHTTQVLRDWLSATYQPERITPSPEPSP